jgi:hypothetical protein
MRYKVRILGQDEREFILDGDFQHPEHARPQARSIVEEERSDVTDAGYKIVPLPEIQRADVTDELVRRFLTRYREVNWPDEDPEWRKMQVDSAVGSFRAALDGGYEPDGARWGLKGVSRDSKVRFRIRDDFKGGIWVRFTIYANAIALGVPKHKEVCEAMMAVVAELEGEFPVVGER